MPARVRPINLLPASDFELSFWGRFLKWAVTAGRYIIIVTELIVILAFLSRFKLDQDVADLASTLEGERNVLEAQKGVEEEFKLVQAKLTAADKMLGMQMQSQAKIEKIVSKIPPEIKLSSLIVLTDRVTITANTVSEKPLGDMLLRFSRDESIKAVEIGEVESNELTGISATLTIKL